MHPIIKILKELKTPNEKGFYTGLTVVMKSGDKFHGSMHECGDCENGFGEVQTEAGKKTFDISQVESILV
jgi:hypothetical protein